MSILSHYTGGNAGWGTMVSACADCGNDFVLQYADMAKELSEFLEMFEENKK